MEIGILLLAAGNSSRLGQPKQLLQFNDTSLLQNTIVQAKKVPNSFVLVVTGAYKESIDIEIAKTEAQSIHNPYWESGMASSIAVGLQQLQDLKPAIRTCIISVCDQPYISTILFEDLIKKHKVSRKGIVASNYLNIVGVPVLFDSDYFAALKNLQGNEGAKKMIQQHQHDIAIVAFEKGAIDIDTIDDYNKLINKL
ncbi:molybdenum cofactor cytidylyltransferase [Flavobacterium tiangeerense]|uniref:Molybdenum cofactor cytidylyltransferase n=1 Tax=Flavobacterium tiangeerense TaxID=459471 RepID=A0ABY3FKR2_9FLAO|nr:nucleotidyltransferase family protein [Flavobacterium tiangeerense]TWI00594.1 molybdenum cofactor cytidylyltransferase [Flavobacterium tiangeerense]